MKKHDYLQDDKELQDFLALFTPEKADPDPLFQKNLKTKMLQRYHQKNSIAVLISQLKTIFEGGLSFMPTKFKFAAVVSLVLVFLISFSSFGILYYQKGQKQKFDKNNVLAKILQNNPQSALNPYLASPAYAAEKNQTENFQGETVTDAAYNAIKAFNYSHTKIQTIKGPQSCPAYFSSVQGQLQTIENFDYYGQKEENAQYYNKWLTYDQDGDLTQYSLSTNDSSIEYRGGKYAVKIIYPQNLKAEKLVTESYLEEVSPLAEINSETVNGGVVNSDETVSSSEPVDPKDLALGFFGNDSQVEKVTENGLEYYIVTWKSEAYCEEGINLPVNNSAMVNLENKETDSEINNATHYIIYRTWTRVNDYNIVKEEQYLDEINPDKLIMTVITEIENQNVEFVTVADIFNFNYKVEIKEIKLPDSFLEPQKMTEELMSYLQENKIAVLFPTDQDYQLNYAYLAQNPHSSDDPYAFLYDRDFYPEGEKGVKMYAETSMTSSSSCPDCVMDPEPLCNLDFSKQEQDNYTFLPMTVYAGDTNEEVLVNAYRYDPESSVVKLNDITVQINDETVAVHEYIIKFDEFVGSGLVPENGSGENQEQLVPNARGVVIFTYQGYLYVVMQDQIMETQKVNLPVFRSYNLLNESDYQFLEIEFNKTLDASVNYSEPEPATEEPSVKGIELRNISE